MASQLQCSFNRNDRRCIHASIAAVTQSRCLPLRAILGDANATFQKVAIRFASKELGLEVLDVPDTAADLVRSARQHRPDLVILDEDLGRPKPLETSRSFARPRLKRRLSF